MPTSQRADTPVVLAVDDLPEYLDLYERRLSDTYEIRTASSGREALDELNDVDVVLLDREMPDLSGDEVLERVRRRERPPQVAIVSATEPDADIHRIGYDAYLVKPVDADSLNRTVDRLVARAEYFETLDTLYEHSQRRATDADAADDPFPANDDELLNLREAVDDAAAEFDVEDFRATYHRLTSFDE